MTLLDNIETLNNDYVKHQTITQLSWFYIINAIYFIFSIDVHILKVIAIN
jgi:hypothetical protein